MGFEPDKDQSKPSGFAPTNPEPVSGFTPDPQPEQLTAAQVPKGEAILEANNAWLSQVVTPDQIDQWKSQGEIGAFEAYKRLDKWEMLPVLNGKTLIDDIAVVKSFTAFKNGEALSPKDKDRIKEYVLEMAEIQARGYSMGGKITDGALKVPAFMGEMGLAFLTAGAALPATFGKKAVKETAKKGTKEFVKRQTKRVGKTSVLAGTATVMMPHRIGKKAIGDHLNDSLVVTDKGRAFIQEAERAPSEYAFRAMGDVFIENFSEAAGGEIIGPAAGATIRAGKRVVPKKLLNGFEKLAQVTTNLPVRKALEKFGWHGLLNEIGEERLGDLLRASTDLDENEGYNTEEFISAVFPDKDDFLVEVGILSIFGTGSAATQGIANKLRSRGVSEKDIEVAVSNMSELEKDAALETFEKIDAPQVEPEVQLEEANRSLEALEEMDVSALDDAGASFIEEQIQRKLIEVENLESVVEQRERELDAQAGKGRIAVPKGPETLAEFLKSAGGLKLTKKTQETVSGLLGEDVVVTDEKLDKSSEIEGMTRKNAPHLKGVANKNGKLSLDEALELAIEEGFIPEPDPNSPTDVETNNLIEAIHEQRVRSGEEGLAVERDQAIDFNQEVDQLNEETAATAKNLKSFKSAFKDGVRSAKADIKAVQKTLNDAINATSLSDKDKQKFTKRIIATQTVPQLRKKAPEIQRSVEKLLGASSLREQKQKLSDELSSKNIKARVVAGKKTGKFSADVQVSLQAIKEALSLNAANAQIALSQNLKKDGQQDVLVNMALNVKANHENINASDVAELVAGVKTLKILGKAQAEARVANRRDNANEVKDQIIDYINTVDPKAKQRKQTGIKSGARSVKQFGRSFVSLIAGSWNDKIDRVAPKSMSHVLGVRREVSKAKQIKRVMQDKLTLAADEAFGTEGNSKKLSNELVSGDKIVTIDGPNADGTWTDANGENVRIEMSRSQGRKLWMASQNEGILENTILHKDGNAYTPEMLEGIFSILDKDRGDYAFAQAQLDIYEDFYEDINEVYRRVFGIDLPKVDFYSPISREADIGEANPDTFLRDIDGRRAIASGSAIHMRDANASSALVLKTDVNAYSAHMNEMANFIAFREKTTLLDSVFGSAKVRKAIELTFGKALNSEIKGDLEAISGMSRVQTNAIEKSVNYLNRNFATSVLGLKAKIGLTQLASLPSYAETIPTKDFLSGTADFFLNYKKAIEILGSTELMQERGASVSVDIARMGRTFDKQFLKRVKEKKSNLIDHTLIFTKFGDRAAIYVGGWAVYRSNIKQGKTHEQAIAAFEEATADTQQSKDVDQLSYFQRSNAVTRGLVMFMSAPIAQFRGEVRTIRRFQKGEATVGELAKGLIIYHVLIPQIYTALANGILTGDVDGEDQFRAFMLGSLAGIPLIGDAVTAAFRAAQGKGNRPKEALKAFDDIVDALAETYEALEAGVQGDYEEAIEALIDIGRFTAKVEGLPVDQAERIVEGIDDISSGDTKKGALKVAGFPKSVTGK